MQSYVCEVIMLTKISLCHLDENYIVKLNEHDVFAVAIRREENDTVGHIPQEVSREMCNFLVNGGEAIAEVIGCRYNSGGGMGRM